MTPAVLRSVDKIYVLNLIQRTDRRNEMAAQLGICGLAIDHSPVDLFRAIRPDEAGSFPSIGARGCFLSHLAVLRDARDKQLDRILLLEDDANFSDAFLRSTAADARQLDKLSWAITYLGYRMPEDRPVEANAKFLAISSEISIGTSHAMMFHRTAIEKAVPYLEAMLERPSGDPAGGPMHVDGAYSWFRRDNPDLVTVLPREQWAIQRSSRSDIGEATWRERIPFVGMLRRLRNGLGF